MEEFLARTRRLMVADELKRRREAGMLDPDAPLPPGAQVAPKS
jgi:hypothetical protein